MGDFFNKISNQFNGAFLTSAFFPMLLFLTALTTVVFPLIPGDSGKAFAAFTKAVLDPAQWQANPVAALIFTIGVLVLSVVLDNMNIPIIRLYEGYPWKDSWIAKPLLARRKKHFEKSRNTRRLISKLRREARLKKINHTVQGVVEPQRDLMHLINGSYPDRPGSILPTKLGNVIRGFEVYPRRQYGGSAINLWPRLVAVVDGNLKESLQSAKTYFDFMIHCAFLSGILGVVTLAMGLYWHSSGLFESGFSKTGLAKIWPWLTWFIFFITISYLFYLASISRAAEWGTQVKAAFDLYRNVLLEKLGYEHKPTTAEEERKIWTDVNYKFAFPDDDTYLDLPYKSLPSYLIVDPTGTFLEAKREVKLKDDGSSIVQLVTVVVSNNDPAAISAKSVILREAIPTGYAYLADSTFVEGERVTLLSVDPLEIDLGPLPYNQSRKVCYCIVKAP